MSQEFELTGFLRITILKHREDCFIYLYFIIQQHSSVFKFTIKICNLLPHARLMLVKSVKHISKISWLLQSLNFNVFPHKTIPLWPFLWQTIQVTWYLWKTPACCRQAKPLSDATAIAPFKSGVCGWEPASVLHCGHMGACEATCRQITQIAIPSSITYVLCVNIQNCFRTIVKYKILPSINSAQSLKAWKVWHIWFVC